MAVTRRQSRELATPAPKAKVVEDDEALPPHMTERSPTRYEQLRLFAKRHTPAYLHEPFVATGYRVNLSFKACCRSLFQAHNETGNIWTHLLGALIFVFIGYYTLSLVPVDSTLLEQVKHFGQDSLTSIKEHTRDLDLAQIGSYVRGLNFSSHLRNFANATSGYCHDSAHDVADYIMQTPIAASLSRMTNATITSAHDLANYMHRFEHMDLDWKPQLPDITWDALRRELLLDTQNSMLPRWPMMYYAFTACMCMFLSTIFHTFGCVSYKWYSWGSRLDYAGISLLISGSSVPFHYYGFHGSSLQIPYVVCVIFFGVAGMLVLSIEAFNHEKFRTLRTFLFLGLAGVVGIPMLHQVILFGFDEPRVIAVKGILASGSLYILGVIVFLSRYPERLFDDNKFFDIWFTSHQIWHILVFCAALSFWRVHIHFWRAMIALNMQTGIPV